MIDSDGDGATPRMRLTGADLAEVEKAAVQEAVRKIVASIRHDSASALTTTAAYIERGDYEMPAARGE